MITATDHGHFASKINTDGAVLRLQIAEWRIGIPHLRAYWQDGL